MTDVARRALVTGAAGGIGGATVAVLRERGMAVTGIDAEPADDSISCDVTDPAAVDAAVAAAADRLGGLDVVVNVVGISGRRFGDGPVHECTDEAWQRVFDVNVRSVFLVCRAAIPHLGPGSAVVNVSSVLGLTGEPSGLFATHAYAASKAAIVGLSRAMAATYASRGIRVNVVAPGLVQTPMSARAQHDADVLAVAGARQVLTGPMLDPNSVANAIAFFASRASEGTTGVVLPVDGGWLTT